METSTGSSRRPTLTVRSCAGGWPLLLLAVVLTGCGGGKGDDTVPPPAPSDPAPPPPAPPPPSPPPPSPPPPGDTTPPTVPSGVTATAQSPTEVVVQWQASTDSGTGVAGYRVFRNGGSSPVATVTSGTRYVDSGLQPATEYRYAVSAFDGASPPNDSALSPTVTATTPPAPPPAGTLKLETERAYPSVPSFESPVLALQAPSSSARWYVVEQAGRVRVFEARNDADDRDTFVDLRSRVRSGGETGLLGMAFHPEWPGDPRVFLSYTAHEDGDLVSRISEFRSTNGGESLDPDSERVLLTVEQPASNHNGGHLAFGPDGLLYAGFGDGGGAGDPWGQTGNGQNLKTLHGKIIRIDVRDTSGQPRYRIPPGNPYANRSRTCHEDGSSNQECPEIYAYGFRNPWRWSFDRATGALWVGDVGEKSREEVNRIDLGGNYGWRCYEGTLPFEARCGNNAGTSLPPVAEYAPDAGQAVTGGYVYRGSAYPALVGRYVFGDFVSGRLWHLPANVAPTQVVTSQSGDSTGRSIVSFAQANDGELYLVDYRSGTLYRIVARN